MHRGLLILAFIWNCLSIIFKHHIIKVKNFYKQFFAAMKFEELFIQRLDVIVWSVVNFNEKKNKNKEVDFW